MRWDGNTNLNIGSSPAIVNCKQGLSAERIRADSEQRVGQMKQKIRKSHLSIDKCLDGWLSFHACNKVVRGVGENLEMLHKSKQKNHGGGHVQVAGVTDVAGHSTNFSSSCVSWRR